MADSSVLNPTSFLSQYRNINNKLKKRFLRKPNIAECCDQFGQLALDCQNEDYHPYAGLCYTAVARCESQLNNSNGEAWAQVNAGKQFLKAHTKDEKLGLLSPGGGEHLQAALGCFQSAEDIWKRNKWDIPLAVSLNLQTADYLTKLSDRDELSAEYFDKAARQLEDTPQLQLIPLEELASSKLKMGHYEGALSAFNQIVEVVHTISDEPFGIYADMVLRCEICRVMLLMLIRPPPQQLTQQMTTVLERYSWIDDNNKSPVDWMNDDLFLLLQSFVMACQTKDVESLKFLEGDLWKHLDKEQKTLLRTVVEVVSIDCDK